jgi:hypothetical protein
MAPLPSLQFDSPEKLSHDEVGRRIHHAVQPMHKVPSPNRYHAAMTFQRMENCISPKLE